MKVSRNMKQALLLDKHDGPGIWKEEVAKERKKILVFQVFKAAPDRKPLWEIQKGPMTYDI